MDQAEIVRRRDKGAALLDEKIPGWWKEFDLGDFQIKEDCACVLGIVLGGFLSGGPSLGLPDLEDYENRQDDDSWDRYAEHGFCLPSHGILDIKDQECSLDRLEIAWAELILERQEADRAADA